MLNVKVNDVLFFNYGAMYPTFTAKVDSISECGTLATYTDIDDMESTVAIDRIREYGSRSVNGSPIGVFLKESV